MKTRFTAIIQTLLIAALIMTRTLIVQAQDYMTLAIKYMEAAGNELYLLVSVDVPDPGEEAEFFLTLDDEPMVINAAGTVGETGIGVSYLILVDVSGSMTQAHKQQIADVVSGIADGMKEGDNAAISFMGTDVVSTGFTDDREALKEVIRSVTDWNQYSNLYYSIHNGLRMLEDHHEVHPERCLVIITDGEDHDAQGITKTEAEQKIDDAMISVCTVAVSTQDARMQEYAKELGSFARRSPGGLHQVIGQNGLDAKGAAEAIVRHMNNTLLVIADIGAYEPTGDTSVIEFSATSARYGATAVRQTVSSTFLTAGLTPEEPEEVQEATEEEEEAQAEEAQTEEPLPEEEPVQEESSMLPVVLIIAGALCVVIALAVIFSKKKKKQEELPVEAQDTGSEAVVMPKGSVGEQAVHELKIRLTKLGLKETQEKKAVVRGSLVIGRTSQKAGLVIDEAKISAAHCKLVYDGEKLTVEDLDSTNGTWVNGIPAEGARTLADQDILTMGGSEWRISF